MKLETLGIKRKRKELSRKELADDIGVSPQFIRQLEIGEKLPSLATAAKIAAALGCTIDDLMKGSDQGVRAG